MKFQLDDIVLPALGIITLGLFAWWYFTMPALGSGIRKRGTLGVKTYKATDVNVLYSGAVVHLDMTDGYETISRVGTTNSTGFVYFANIPEGQYRLQIDLSGYRRWDELKDIRFSNDGTTQASFGMAPA